MMDAMVSTSATGRRRQNLDDARWEAFARRDIAADGTFVVGVKTTGIYCRPSCPARRAKRENVTFFATCEEAVRAGFRACKRCLPDEASQAERHGAAVARACRLIEEAETMPNLDALAETAGLSRFHFHRVFKAVTGVTPGAYAAQHRSSRVAAQLRVAPTVTSAIYDGGFNAASRFYESVPGRLGMTPTAFRNAGRGITIRFALGTCSLGTVLVAATDKGICAIMFGDDPDRLIEDFQTRFAKADLVGGDAEFERLVSQVVGFVERPRAEFDLPLDVIGTAFQQRVWEALRAIPAGSTATYAEIASAIGQPKAARAVGAACGANPIAIAIPCHRVVHHGGGKSGYRWGVERKRELLEREAG